MTSIITQITNYLTALDWGFILTFIILCYGINQRWTKGILYDLFAVKIPTRYRVCIVGVLYGVFIYFIRGYSPKMIESLVQSFVFSLVFHKLLLEKLLSYLTHLKTN